jgi:hypothetical protein
MYAPCFLCSLLFTPTNAHLLVWIISCTECSLHVFLFVQLIVEHCEIPIKSVELQLVRVETCGYAEGYARDGKYKNFMVFISMH